MTGIQPARRRDVLIEPDGRIIFPEPLMEEVVLYTIGCQLWFNDKDMALGIKLLRNVDDPPYRIERIPGDGGRERGVLAAGAFLREAGFTPPASVQSCPVRFHTKYHMLEIKLGESTPRPALKTEGFLDDYVGLDD